VLRVLIRDGGSVAEGLTLRGVAARDGTLRLYVDGPNGDTLATLTAHRDTPGVTVRLAGADVLDSLATRADALAALLDLETRAEALALATDARYAADRFRGGSLDESE
jgi:hypothetical protein